VVSKKCFKKTKRKWKKNKEPKKLCYVIILISLNGTQPFKNFKIWERNKTSKLYQNIVLQNLIVLDRWSKCKSTMKDQFYQLKNKMNLKLLNILIRFRMHKSSNLATLLLWPLIPRQNWFYPLLTSKIKKLKISWARFKQMNKYYHLRCWINL